MDAESRLNGHRFGTEEAAGFFTSTVESLRNHVDDVLRPHVDEVIGSVTELVRAEKEHLAQALEPVGEGTRRASIALAVAVTVGLFSIVFAGSAAVAVIVLTADGQAVPILLGIGAALLAGALITGMMFTRSLGRLKTDLKKVTAQYTEDS